MSADVRFQYFRTRRNQYNAFGRLVGHPPAAEKRRNRKLGCVVGASDTIMFINGYHRNQPIERRMHP